MSTKPTTVDEYIEQAPAPAQERLRELRAILRSVAPGATEALKWGYPVFEQGRILFAYAAFRKHINFMPTPATLAHFRTELGDWTTGTMTMQLPHDRPLPKALIKRIAEHRVTDLLEHDARWM